MILPDFDLEIQRESMSKFRNDGEVVGERKSNVLCDAISVSDVHHPIGSINKIDDSNFLITTLPTFTPTARF